MNSSKTIWIKTHTRNERFLAEALRRMFGKLRTANAKQVEKAVSAEDPKALLALFPREGVKKAIVKAAKPHITRMVSEGAKAEWQQAMRKRPKRMFAFFRKHARLDDLVRAGSSVNLPKVAREAIAEWADEILEQDYWKNIAETLRRDLARKLERGITEGLNGKDLAKEVLQALGPQGSAARANNISRTETTSALNSGHQAVRNELEKDGLIKGKMWLAIVDNDTRDDHADADEQEVKNDEPFVVGGEECEFPGDFSLSSEQRCQCRCAAVSTFSEE